VRTLSTDRLFERMRPRRTFGAAWAAGVALIAASVGASEVAFVHVRRVRQDGAARDSHVGHREGEPVGRPQCQRFVERGVVFVLDDDQGEEPRIDLFRGESVRMRMKPVEPAAVPDPEFERLRTAGLDRIETRAILRLGERETVKVNGRGLRQPVLDHGVESISLPRDEDGPRNPLRPGIGDIVAAAKNRIAALDHDPPHALERNGPAAGDRRRPGPGGTRSVGRGTRRADGGNRGGEEFPAVQGAINRSRRSARPCRISRFFPDPIARF